MRKVLLALLIVLLIPVYLVAYISIHEIGHTIPARLLGDPNAVYYLIKIDQYSQAIGRTDYDIAKLSWGANLIVTMGGVLGTQVVALIALFLLRLRPENRLLARTLSIVAFTFAFDVPFQLMQGLAYRGTPHWPTNVDFMDIVLLLQMQLHASQPLLKSLLVVVVVLYLVGFVWLYRRNSLPRRLLRPTPEAA